MKVTPIINEKFYTWVAPDGNVQLALMAEDISMCVALIKLFSKSGMSKTQADMEKEGFEIKPIRLTIIEAE